MNIEVELIARIIEGAIEGDIRKVRAYAGLIVGNLEYEGHIEEAEIISSRLDGSYKGKEVKNND